VGGTDSTRGGDMVVAATGHGGSAGGFLVLLLIADSGVGF